MNWVVLIGALSTYHAHDGNSGAYLACGGVYWPDSVHVAIRGAKRHGCGKTAVICSIETARCITAPIMDSGPWGFRNQRCFKYRGMADLSRGAWIKLGRPRFNSIGVMLI